jgi:hypothetical protein
MSRRHRAAMARSRAAASAVALPLIRPAGTLTPIERCAPSSINPATEEAGMWPFSVSVAFVLGIVVSSLLWKREVNVGGRMHRHEGGRYPFRRTEVLLNDTELLVYKLLQHEVGESAFVFPKVRLSDIVDLPKRVERRDFLMNLVKSKGIDFVVCTSEKAAPVIAIQVGNKDDDNELITDVTGAAGLPFLQLPNKRAFEPGELTELIRQARRDARSVRSEPVSQV